MNDIMQLTAKDLDALQCFRNVYPTWWYTIGVCDRSRDFTCAPQANSPEAPFIEIDNKFNNAFRCDHEGALADAIGDVMEQIIQEKKRTGCI